MDVSFSNLKDQIFLAITQYGGKILLALIVFIIGRKIITKASQLLGSKMTKSNFDKDVQPFLISLVSVALNIMLLLSCAGILGIQTTSFVAVLGAAGLAVGLALQGSLSNFAGGVLILIFKPYKVGDLISAQGFTGTVESVQIFNTILVTPDNKTLILPNGSLATSAITNISGKGTIRVDMVFAVGNQNSLESVKKAFTNAVKLCPTALQNIEHDILLNSMTENALKFDVRVWTNSENYWATYYGVTELVYEHLKKEGIEAPKIHLNLHQLS